MFFSYSRWVIQCTAACCSLPILLLGLLHASEPKPVDFNRDIRPILSDKCFACHGFDPGHRQADLRLDIPEAAFDNARSQVAITPGDLSKSEVWARVTTTDPETIMPPPDSHKELTEAERAIIKRWIEEGAKYAKHWSFEIPQSVALPSTSQPTLNEIDLFLGQKLDELNLQAGPIAPKEILIRRLAFALTGLPPSSADVKTFLEDASDQAYSKLVEKYLESPQFGEEMARHWLDVARYADTHGMHLDNERQTWAYRDWVIRVFNQNLPFDQFTIAQLAGDLLPDPTEEQLIATGFNRCNVTTSEGGSINDELLYRYAVDRTSTTISAWMGLTGGCAVCHDHKFDPISQREFYQMYAFFNSAADPGFDGNALLTQPVLKLNMPEIRSQQQAIDEKLAGIQKQIDEKAATVVYQDPATAEPKPETMIVENVWMDDEFPTTGHVFASPGAATQYVENLEGGSVFSGKRAVKRTDAGLAQDVWDQAKEPLMIPQGGNLFAYVWLDPANPPKSIMLQYHRSGWQHRAVWGDYEAIQWGAANTTERVAMGPLPEVGKWVRLDIPVDKVGLNPGDGLTGFAMTQFGGTVYWDKVGVAGAINPTTDPQRSFQAWWQQVTGKDVPGIPDTIRELAKAGPKPDVDSTALQRYYVQAVCETTKSNFTELRSQAETLKQERQRLEDSIPSTFVFRDMPSPRESFVMMRGAYDKKGDPVQPEVFAFLPPLQKADPAARASRLDLAKWLVAPNHPLTARVTVNRFWQQFFGVGLVKSSYDFGSQGELPSHPELLDWLAVRFQTSGWDIKQFVRLLVHSAAFQRDSRVEPNVLAQDFENRFYARGPRFRLDAEQIRDNALKVSGLLIDKMGGKGVKPYQPSNIWEPVGFAGSNTRFYSQDMGEALYRRSIYTFLKRTAPPPFMSNFDGPNREQFCARRERSNTPLQALQLMNDVQHVEAARVLAQRTLKEGGSDDTAKIRFVFQEVLSRQPAEDEIQIVQSQLNLHRQRYSADKEAATKLVAYGESQRDETLDVAELAAFSLVSSMMLNLDETLTRN